MLTKDGIEQFYSDVDKLGLRFPVSAISGATKVSKGTVSEYLSRKKEPSEKFVKAFYQMFSESLKKVQLRTEGTQEPAKATDQSDARVIKQASHEEIMALYVDSLKEQKRILEVQNEFLRRNFEVSLNAISEGQEAIKEAVHADRNHLKALTWYKAWIQAGRNDKRAEVDLTRIRNKAAEYAGVTPKRGSPGKRHTGIQNG